MPHLFGIREVVWRTAELATVGRAVDGARKGVPSVLPIGGDAGIGKSALSGRYSG
jgi:hypothetical protein